MTCEFTTIPDASRGPFLARKIRAVCTTHGDSSDWGDGVDAKAWKARHLKLVSAAADVAAERAEVER